MLTGSKTFTGWNNSGSWTLAKDAEGFTVASKAQSGMTSLNYPSLYSPKVTAKKGETFTFSCYFMVDDVSTWDYKVPYIFEVKNSSNSRVQHQDVHVTANNTNNPTVQSGKWVYFYSTHTVTAEEASYVWMRLALFENGSIHVKKCKIERGATATPWIPAQGD